MNAITEILNKFGEATVEEIRGNMARAGQNATGNTANSLQSEVIGDNRLQVSGPAYIYVLEEGRGPYKGGPDSNLKSKILTWMQAKGVRPRIGQTMEQAAKGITYAINKKGTNLFQQGGRKDIITSAISQERIDQVVKQIADAQTKVLANAVVDS